MQKLGWFNEIGCGMTVKNMAAKDKARRSTIKAIRKGEATLSDGRAIKRQVQFGSVATELREDVTQEPIAVFPEVKILDPFTGTEILIPERRIFPQVPVGTTPDGGTRSWVRATASGIKRSGRQAERRLCREARYTGETPLIDEVTDLYGEAYVRVHSR